MTSAPFPGKMKTGSAQAKMMTTTGITSAPKYFVEISHDSLRMRAVEKACRSGGVVSVTSRMRAGWGGRAVLSPLNPRLPGVFGLF